MSYKSDLTPLFGLKIGVVLRFFVQISDTKIQIFGACVTDYKIKQKNKKNKGRL